MGRTIWSGVYRTFQDATGSCEPWGDDTWLDHLAARAHAAHASLSETATIPSVAVTRTYPLPFVAAVVGGATGGVRILDFGGGLGATYYELRAASPDLAFDFHVVETAAVCAAAADRLPEHDRPHFHDALPALDNVDIVHLGSSLHYVEDWRGLLARMASYGAAHVVMGEVTADDIAETFVTRQHYYGHWVPVWFWRLSDLVTEMESLGYRLLHRSRYETFYLGKFGGPPVTSLPESHQPKCFCNLVFRRVE